MHLTNIGKRFTETVFRSGRFDVEVHEREDPLVPTFPKSL